MKQMKHYEALKRKKRDVSEYTATMRDENNIIEIDGSKRAFHRRRHGHVRQRVSFDIPKTRL